MSLLTILKSHPKSLAASLAISCATLGFAGGMMVGKAASPTIAQEQTNVLQGSQVPSQAGEGQAFGDRPEPPQGQGQQEQQQSQEGKSPQPPQRQGGNQQQMEPPQGGSNRSGRGNQEGGPAPDVESGASQSEKNQPSSGNQEGERSGL